MKVLVTGGNGFIGRHAVKALIDQGHNVIVASRAGVSSSPDAEGVQVDLLADGAAVSLMDRLRPDGVLHMAWETTHGSFWTAPENAQWKVITQDILDRFMHWGGQRAVFAGSCTEYGWKDLADDEVCVESQTSLNSDTYYGQQKRDAFLDMDERRKEDVSLAWGRLFFLYGEGEAPTRFVPYVIRKLLADQPAQMSSGCQVRDFMDSRDAGRAFAELFDKPQVCGAVNIASGEKRSLRQVAEQIAKIIGRPDLLEFGVILDRENDPKTVVADVQRLYEEVGFQPQYSLSDGLKHMIETVRAEV